MKKHILKVSKVITVNLIFMALIFLVFSFGLRAWLNWSEGRDSEHNTEEYTIETIAATHPNYEHMREEAHSIANEWVELVESYVPFVGWRRNPYSGSSINIEPEFQTRMSYGHSQEDSVWFIGGSTTWGRGSSDDETIPSFFSKLTGEKSRIWEKEATLLFRDSCNCISCWSGDLFPKRSSFTKG